MMPERVAIERPNSAHSDSTSSLRRLSSAGRQQATPPRAPAGSETNAPAGGKKTNAAALDGGACASEALGGRAWGYHWRRRGHGVDYLGP
jgi:hypothetical protein